MKKCVALNFIFLLLCLNCLPIFAMKALENEMGGEECESVPLLVKEKGPVASKKSEIPKEDLSLGKLFPIPNDVLFTEIPQFFDKQTLGAVLLVNKKMNKEVRNFILYEKDFFPGKKDVFYMGEKKFEECKKILATRLMEDLRRRFDDKRYTSFPLAFVNDPWILESPGILMNSGFNENELVFLNKKNVSFDKKNEEITIDLEGKKIVMLNHLERNINSKFSKHCVDSKIREFFRCPAQCLYLLFCALPDNRSTRCDGLLCNLPVILCRLIFDRD